MSHDLAYQIITDRIIALLEKGTIPWHQPWNADTGMPKNLITKKEYRGINVFMLGSSGYESPWWLSFPKQVNDKGGTLRKGEKCSYVIFWKHIPVTERDEATGEDRTKRVPMLRYYKVVNAAQCTGLTLPAITPDRTHTPIESCESLIASMPHRPEIRHDDTRAYYRPSTDSVHMPRPERFFNTERYYSTLFHELTHSTGHTDRLNRPTLRDMLRFGDTNYSKEELVAEMGAAFLCGVTGIENRTVDSSAAYIKGWLHALRNDKKLLVHAGAQAQKAADFIRGITFED